MAMLLVGGTMSVFAQNTQTTPTTNQSTNTSTTTPTTQQTTGTTGDPTSTTGGNVSNMSNMASDTVKPGAPSTTGNWNGVSASTSWTPETPPAYSWNNYGNWQNMGSVYPTGNRNANNMNNTASANNGTMSSTGSYSAYGGTAVSNLPANVQMRFNQDFPTGANNQYSWNQYGDWFHTHYVNNGRLWQYFYSTRGDGYALVLPVVHTYVPENIINSAIQKYGSSLYSIGMVKTNSGADAYQIGLIQGGQLNTQYLDESGVSVNDVWRVDSTGMDSTQTNAAMGSGTTSGNWSSDASSSQQSSMSTDMNSQSGDMNNQSSNQGKTKMKIKHADGSETKIKTKDGQTKVKTSPATNDQTNQQQ